MKKLMIAAAIVCAAALSQAASISWSTGNLVDHNGDVLKYATDYTATVYFFADQAGTQDISASKFGNVLVGTEASKKGEYSATVANPTAATGTYYTKVVITDGKWTLESDIASFSYDADAFSGTSINFQDGQGLSKAVLNNTGTNFGWQSVPEPTSGLLLLLGVGALALRRRRA